LKTILSLLLLCATTALAQITNLSFTWDASPGASGYRFYDMVGTNRFLLGTSSSNAFTVIGWNLANFRTVTVTATNMVGESQPAPSLTVPPGPTPPLNLKPIPLSLVAPVPSVVELSQDLVTWVQRIRLATGPTSAVQLTWFRYPTEPMMFMRTRVPPLSIAPPLP
jgi:hypothetical protein